MPDVDKMMCWTKSDDKLKAGEFKWTEDIRRSAKPVEMPAFDVPDEDDPEFLEASKRDPDLGVVKEADVSQFPYSAAGKLFAVSKIDGSTWYGTGQFIGPNTILTAAHVVTTTNVHNRVSFMDNPVFHRAYCDGGGEEFEIVSMCVWKKYAEEQVFGEFVADYAICTTRQRYDGRCLVLRTDEISEMTEVKAIGYPSNFGNGERMQKVRGLIRKINEKKPFSGVMRMRPNPMRKGCSGGAWIMGQFKTIGLNSHSRLNPDGSDKAPYSEWGPRFNYRTKKLMDAAEDGC